jgi:predicted lipid-binding transport protein (Tim44 family)
MQANANFMLWPLALSYRLTIFLGHWRCVPYPGRIGGVLNGVDPMSNFRRFTALALAAALAFAPLAANARAGAGSSGRGASSYSSMGSMGRQTYAPTPGAAPITRSVTPNTQANPGYGSTAPSAGYGLGGGYYPRPSFWSGFAGGLFGAWFGHMLFGHSAYGYDGGAMHSGGFFGSLIMLLIVGWIAHMLFRAFFGRSFFSGFATNPMGFGQPAASYQPMPQRAIDPPVALSQQDFDAFGQILTGVQACWSHQNLEGMRRYVTPEILGYFSELLSDNASNGVANRVEQVALVQGEPRKSWREDSVEYASTYLKWSAIDFTHRLGCSPSDPGFLVEGDTRTPLLSEEIWTFRRTVGGRWLLSAIQQTSR